MFDPLSRMGSLVVQIIILSLFTVLLTFLLFLFPGKDDGDATRAQILVLGDIARSPRMRNHALSLARHGIRVDLIGYVGKILKGDQENIR